MLGEGDDACEISLVENAVRAPLHPDDQCEAFRTLTEERGMSAEDVAARFGVTPAVVRRRLKLAAVSPKLRALYRKGEMTLEHVMALSVSDDHAAQEQAWTNLPDWNRDPDMLRQALTHEAVALTDKLARFVGIEAYQAAGGAVMRDLFDDEDECYLCDRALLLRLATDKMADAVAEVQAEGWKWVKAEPCRDYATRYSRIYPQQREDDDESDAELSFTAEDKALAGAQVMLSHDGTLEIERGLVHPDEAKAGRRRELSDETADEEGRRSGFLPSPVVEELSAHRTAALRVELARNPAVALAATVHALARGMFYPGADAPCLDIKAVSKKLEPHTRAPGDSPAHQAMDDLAVQWGDRLPGDAASLFAWCLTQPQDVLLDLLAYLSALSVDAVTTKHQCARGTQHADALAQTLGLDMHQWWAPTAEGFYGRLPKAVLAEAVREAQVPPLGVSVDRLKKTEAVRLVAGALKGSGWLPQPLKVALALPEAV